jgi:hypothetical protein
VDDDILSLLTSQNFIQASDHSIAYLPLPLKSEGNSILIIEISQDNLKKRVRDEFIIFKSPWDKVDYSEC